MDFTIRSATIEDSKDINRMILELAECEKIADQVLITQTDLEQDGFSKNSFFHALIAEVPEENKTKDGHTKIGFSMYFYIYSWKGKGIGKALMCKVAWLGQAAGCTQLKFTALNWNKSALDFYQNQGSIDLTSEQGYHYMCFQGDAFQKMADRGC
ncbi:hypothetical protein HF521_019586 [Silurus meridionalis]|uniref:N-acetyltransferase domain-containing protein n=1 Tax=Silurus meridionalis TaxID=175797 RepID=A0A8T0BGH0_SILME|nr:hypothetical protein HF521_019586 [Silurus meridionalis]